MILAGELEQLFAKRRELLKEMDVITGGYFLVAYGQALIDNTNACLRLVKDRNELIDLFIEYCKENNNDSNN